MVRLIKCVSVRVKVRSRDKLHMSQGFIVVRISCKKRFKAKIRGLNLLLTPTVFFVSPFCPFKLLSYL